MRKIFLLLIILSVSNLIFAQTYKEYWHTADSLYRIKEYKQAGIEFDNALKLKEGDKDNYAYAASAWASAGDTTKALHYLNLTADKGWYRKKLIENDSVFVFLHKFNEWDTILKKIQANIDEYEKDYNKPLKAELEDIIIKDQTLRLLIKEAEEKFGKDSKEMEYFWELIAWQDSINEKRIIEIIDEYGWPGTSLVGSKANTAVWLIIQHTPLETQELYLSFLQASVKNGESSVHDMAYLEDRILSYKNLPQKFGTQIDINSETGEYTLYDLEDPENVNKRRAEVGLGPIEKYLKLFNIEWGNNKTP